MILADTSIWADHFRAPVPVLADLLARGQIAMHPFVQGEIALGYLRRRSEWMLRLGQLPTLQIAEPEEVLHLIESEKLIASGLGYVDVHLLATTLITQECKLWSRDKRLAKIASRLDVAAEPVN